MNFLNNINRIAMATVLGLAIAFMPGCESKTKDWEKEAKKEKAEKKKLEDQLKRRVNDSFIYAPIVNIPEGLNQREQKAYIETAKKLMNHGYARNEKRWERWQKKRKLKLPKKKPTAAPILPPHIVTRNKIRNYILKNRLWEKMTPHGNPYAYIVPAAMIGWLNNVNQYGRFYSASITPKNAAIQKRFKIPTFTFRSSVNPNTQCEGLQIIKPWSYSVDSRKYAIRIFPWLRNRIYLRKSMRKDYMATMGIK